MKFMMDQHIEKLRSNLFDELFEINKIENSREKVSKVSKVIDDTLQELNQFLTSFKFPNEDQEIAFFKTTKPEIVARRIEEVMRYSLQINKPIGTDEVQQKYYEEEIRAIHSFFRMNSFHYQYYKNGLDTLDHSYFLRSAGPLTVPLADIAQTDTELSTPMSYLFAKFIAYEHMQYFILEQIAILKHPNMNCTEHSKNNTGDLIWTGDAINIIEVAYGIWLLGQLNNGNATLTQIVRWLESSLKVTIGNIQSRFAEISSRKRLSPTKFLDQMKDAILKRINNDNS